MIIHKGKKIGWNIKVMMKVVVLYVEVSKVTICVCPPIRTQLFCQDYQKVFKSLNCACCCIFAIIVISFLSFHINPFYRFLFSVFYSFFYLYLPFSICQLPLSLYLSVLFILSKMSFLFLLLLFPCYSYFFIFPFFYSEGPAFSPLSSCNLYTPPFSSHNVWLVEWLPSQWIWHEMVPGIKLLQLKQVPNNLLYFVMQSRPILTSVAMATVNHGEMRSGRE